MKRIFGRVLVKETNVGVANLVVAAFDHEGSNNRGNEIMCAGLALGHRLGSVLTAEDGSFAISTDQCEPAGGPSRPDLVLAVFAPEDATSAQDPMPLPPEKRILHVSRVARHHAGAIEAFVIRLLQVQLDEFGIPTWTPGERSSGLTDATHHLSVLDQKNRLRTLVTQRLAPEVAQFLKRKSELRDMSKGKFSGLTAVPLALQLHPLRALDANDAEQKHVRAVTSGAKRLQENYSGSVVLRLESAEVESLGLGTPATGEAAGTVSGDAVAERMLNSSGNDLTRRRALIDACVTKPPTPPSPQTPPATPPAETAPAPTGEDVGKDVLARVQGQLADLPVELAKRPVIEDVHVDLDALEIKGGPADATAFHDFHVVQLAFKQVWLQAFSEDVRTQAEQLYEEVVRVYDDAQVALPPFDAIKDMNQLKGFVADVARTGLSYAGGGCGSDLPFPNETLAGIPDLAPVWSYLSFDQQSFVTSQLADLRSTDVPTHSRARAAIQAVAQTPDGDGGRLAKLTYELGKALAEPYAFDVFAPNTYNFGVMLTYRQKWEPLAYQAGELVATIPLAPLESRKYSTKKITKTTRAVKEIEKSMSSRSGQSSTTGRAESEIMQKASTATNFKMTASGSFNIGIGSINASSEFGLNQSQESASTKKAFHETTLKAAEEYRLERSLEVSTSHSEDVEQINSGEISNPNNELTVTYLFYELERRFQVTEHLHRARAVILVAQDVPAPHEIDESWIVQYTWILSRVLLDDSLRAALDYISSGFAGDEVSIEVIKARWQDQRQIVAMLEARTTDQLSLRDSMRELLVQKTQDIAMAKTMEMPLAAKIFTLGMMPDPGEKNAEMLAAQQKAAETRLNYVEEALADAQEKLGRAGDAFEHATRDYAAALQNQYTRHVAIDQLRIHLKQNILYYMQAIWDHEPPDQRFFRLYNKKISVPEPGTGLVAQPVVSSGKKKVAVPAIARGKTRTAVSLKYGNTINMVDYDLVDLADLDNPIGYKGNYIMFPLKKSCHITTVMLQEYVDDYFGVRDPDELGNYTIEELEHYVECVQKREDVTDADKADLRQYYLSRIEEDRIQSDMVIVPTGQLFIEALPGSHPLLEDFKLLHRREDVRKVRAEVRHAELENLRLAARIAANKLEDPDIEKRVIIDDGTKYVDT